jgi:hypothetical protein
MSARRVVLAMLSALLAWGGAARKLRADGGPPLIYLDLETCPPNWAPEIRLALAVELGDERLATAPTDEQMALSAGHRLRVRCAEHRVWVVAHDARTAATLERTLTGDLPQATAPRTIALVAADLLTTFDPALRRRLEAPVKPSAASSAPSAPSAASSPPTAASSAASSPPSVASASTASPPTVESHRLFLTAGAVYRTFFSSGGIDAWGGTLDARRASRDGRWSTGVDVEIAGADRSTTIGQTSVLLASARASAGTRVSLARDRFAFAFDLGARGGLARMSGRANDASVAASTAVHPWAGPVASLRAEVALFWFCAGIAAEGGWAAVSASGIVNGGPALAASGPWLALSLSVGARR